MKPSPRLLQRPPVWWAALLALAAPLAAAQDSCTPAWIPTFGGYPGVDGTVRSFAVFDDGSGAGPALYAAGGFEEAGAVSAQGIARWDGESWSGLASGITGVEAIVVFDDGSGPALYAGGTFTAAGGQPANRIVKWDGQDWSPLGSGLDGAVRALAVFDDGSGPALYAAGVFKSAAGASANRIAKWDGMSWSALGSGMSGGVVTLVRALAVFDDGSGPALYAGGEFTIAGGVAASRVARWDGASWSALGSGLSDQVSSLATFDDGSGAGPALHVGGFFFTAGGAPASRIAKWDGQSWSALGSGFNAAPEALVAFDDGSGAGPALYACGTFTFAGGVSANRVAKWNGQTWSVLGSGLNAPALALAVFDDGSASGPRIFAGGSFGAAGGLPATGVAAWDGETWGGLGGGLNGGYVYALVEFDDGSGGGPALYAAGQFTNAGGQPAAGLAKWDGQSWSPMASTISSSAKIYALAVFDDGSGDALYVGGLFTSIDGFPASNIAKWDGHSWSGLSGGVGVALAPVVKALTVFDDGAGPALYVGGEFTIAGGQSANRIAKWDGQAWSALGTGVSGTVYALAVFDDGAGPALYAGGFFSSAGGHIAKWDGQSWSALGSGVGPFLEDHVNALTVFDDGSGAGPALYVGGEFILAGGQSANRIAKWDGQSWSALGSGVSLGPSGEVHALAVFDDESGTGPALFVGGHFSKAGGTSVSNIAKWDGQSWSALGAGVSTTVHALAVFDDGAGTGPGLAAGGWFGVNPAGDVCVAKWSCPAIESVPGCFGNPAALTSGSSAASIGETFLLKLSASQLSTGLGLVFFGLDGTDAADCGLFVPGIGELLLALAPMPVQAASDPLSASSVSFALGVPDLPSLIGVEIAFHGVAVGVFDPGIPIELSNGLLVTITL